MIGRSLRAHGFLLLSFAVVSSFAGVAVAAPPKGRLRPVVDHAVVNAARTGIASIHALRRSPDVAVVIELDAPATDTSLAALESAGARLDREGARVLFYDRFVPAHVDSAAAARLSSIPFVTHVSLAPVHRFQPLDRSADLVRLLDARGARQDLDDLTGAGVTVGDSDSLVDVFHPTFFRGDGGYVAWIDVDGDGVFTAGTDAIDLDGDGKAGPGETAMGLHADTVDYGMPVAARKGSTWSPAYDWAYLDTNGNGKRDFGPDGGFDDTTPALGEPLFVPDDLDLSGAIEVGEKFVRLSSSKLRKVRLNVTYDANVKHVFERGVDLIKTPTDLTKNKLYGFPDALHATGVLSIIAGDVPLMGRKWVGMAPDVDIVLSFDADANGTQLPTTGATWLLGEKPDVMLYEMAPWTGLPLDGSDALSAIIDSSTMKSKVTHTCPTGDQGSARKHGRAMIAANAQTTLDFEVPATTKAGVGPLSYVQMSAHVRGGSAQSVSVTAPDGTTFNAAMDGMGTFKNNSAWYVSTDVTTRGTDMYDVILYAGDASAPLPTGKWTLAVTAGSSAISVDGYVSDDKSSWAAGAAWDEGVATDAATIGVPSTADHCIAVGAMPDHLASEASWFQMFYSEYYVPDGFVETAGQVRAYSPRGPRIDGATKPDVLGPDNPWAAYPHSEGIMYSGPYASYSPFGGTSGASPHVTGVAALLAQVGIKGDAARDAIRKGALTDKSMGALPNGDYGYGRLNASGALGVTMPSGDVPTVTILASKAKAGVNEKVTLTPQPVGGGTFQVKWDDGYDGTWDVPYATVAPRDVTSDKPGTFAFKAHVRSSGGRVAEAVTYVTFGPSTTSGNGSGSSGGCGCRATNEASSAGGAIMLGAIALAFVRRRDRSQRKSH